MWLFNLAWKNLWRNRSRTLISVAAIFFAVILSTTAESLKQGVFGNLVKNVVGFYTGYIQLHKAGYQDDQILDNSMMETPSLEKKLELVQNIAAFSPRLETFALASSGELTKGCMVVGIAPESEDAVTDLKKKLIAGEYLLSADKAVLLAQGLSHRMKLNVGDTIVLIGQGFHGAMAAGKFPIKGILNFGSPQLNDRVLYMSLPQARDFVGGDPITTSYVFALKDAESLDQSAALIRTTAGSEYEVLTWEELLPEIKQHIESDSRSMKVIQSILYLLICFGIFSTLLMMMLERKFEMGMLIAIGMKKSKLILLIIIESVLTVALGCIAGILFSIPVVMYLSKYPIRMGGETAKAYERFGFEAIFPATVNSSIFIQQAIIVLILGLILSIYPVYRIVRLNPVKAMKEN